MSLHCNTRKINRDGQLSSIEISATYIDRRLLQLFPPDIDNKWDFDWWRYIAHRHTRSCYKGCNWSVLNPIQIHSNEVSPFIDPIGSSYLNTRWTVHRGRNYSLRNRSAHPQHWSHNPWHFFLRRYTTAHSHELDNSIHCVRIFSSICLTRIDENDGDRANSIECTLCGIGQVIDVIGHHVDHCTRRAIRILTKRREKETLGEHCQRLPTQSERDRVENHRWWCCPTPTIKFDWSRLAVVAKRCCWDCGNRVCRLNWMEFESFEILESEYRHQ